MIWHEQNAVKLTSEIFPLFHCCFTRHCRHRIFF